MKKLAVFSVIFTLLAGAAFGQITIKASAASLFDALTIIKPDGQDAYNVAGFGRSGGAAVTTLGLDVAGANEAQTVGFRAQVNFRNGASGNYSVELGDWGGIWYKPIPQIRLDAGKFLNSTLEGKVGGPGWNSPSGISTGGTGDIFKSFDGRNAVMVSATPVDGLFLGAMAYGLADLSRAATSGFADKPWYGTEKAHYAYQRIQIAAGYTIPDIGMVRVQYFGLNPDVSTGGYVYNRISAPYIQAAFALTGVVDGLTLDIGGKIPLTLSDPEIPNRAATTYSIDATGTIKAGTPATGGTVPVTGLFEMKGKFQQPYAASVGAKYVITGDTVITVPLRLDGRFGGYSDEVPGLSKKTELGPEIRFYLFPSIKMDTLTFQVEGGIWYAGDTKYDGDTSAKGGLAYTFGAFVQKDFAPSNYLRIGLGYAGGETLGTKDDAAKLNGVFSVPVQFSVSF